MLLQLQNATPSAVPVINTARESAIKKRAGVRTTRVEAPDAAKPTGRFSSITEAVEHFLAWRERTILLVAGCRGSSRHSDNTPRHGPVNGYEMLLMMAMHPRRHALQIAEIRDAPAK